MDVAPLARLAQRILGIIAVLVLLPIVLPSQASSQDSWITPSRTEVTLGAQTSFEIDLTNLSDSAVDVSLSISYLSHSNGVARANSKEDSLRSKTPAINPVAPHDKIGPYLWAALSSSTDGPVPQQAGYEVIVTPVFPEMSPDEQFEASLHQRLEIIRETSRTDIHPIIEATGLSYQVEPVTGAVLIENANSELVFTLAEVQTVAHLELNTKIQLTPLTETDLSSGLAIQSETPHLSHLRVTQLHNLGITGLDQSGEPVTIGMIDAAIDWSHPELAGKKKTGELGCYSAHPDVTCNDTVEHIHGTLVAGVMVGETTGAAPQAEIMQGIGCTDTECDSYALFAALAFMLEPYTIDPESGRVWQFFPEERPDIINNSWGNKTSHAFYLDLIKELKAAGTFLVFSAGNAGPGLQKIGSPADYCETFAVGGTAIDDSLYQKSSMGPAQEGGCQIQVPNVSATGKSVTSTIPGGGYGTFDGTSFAAPLTTAVLASLHGAGSWDYTLLSQAAMETARKVWKTRTFTSDVEAVTTEDWHPGYGHGVLDGLSMYQMLNQNTGWLQVVRQDQIFELPYKGNKTLDFLVLSEQLSPGRHQAVVTISAWSSLKDLHVFEIPVTVNIPAEEPMPTPFPTPQPKEYETLFLPLIIR
ncbi:MAG: S8 family serine peptidase [Patescibacteria group bacterium]